MHVSRMLQAMLLSACLAFAAAQAAVAPAAVRAELEKIEDIRVLHRFTIQDLHDAKALALYLKGWQGPDRSVDVEDLLREAEDVYGVVRAVENGSIALQADIDANGANSPSAEQFALVQRVRGEVAARVNDFYARCTALKADLQKQVSQAAQGKVKWEVVSQPEPWQDAAREAGRLNGLTYGYTLRKEFFDLPEAEQTYALGKAAKAGLTFVLVSWAPACDWADLEPNAGAYDFAALDAMMTRLTRVGMKVRPMLASLSGNPPKWAVDKFGTDCQFTTAGKKASEKQQSGINIFHPATGEAYAKFLSAYAAHLKQKFPNAIEAVYVEGVQHETGAVPDESPAMDAYWKAWSKTDTPWRTPESILAVADSGEKKDLTPEQAAAQARAEACREQWLLDYIQKVSVGLKQGWPELTVQITTVNHDMHRIGNHTVEKSRDLYRLSQASPNPHTGATSPASLAILRSMANGRWLWHYFMPIGCGAKTGACNAQAPFFDVSTVAYNSGPGGFDRHIFPAGWFRYADWQLGDFGIGSYYLTPRRCQELSAMTLNTQPVRAEVAVLWSQTTLRRDVSYELHKEAIAWAHLLHRACVDFDYLPEQGLAERLKSFKVLVLPNTQSLTAATCGAIRQWVQNGGILLATGAPGMFDENGARRSDLPLADVFGADIAAMRTPAPVRPDMLYTGHPEGPFITTPPAPWMFQTNLTAALEPAAATPVAWYCGRENDVAITEQAFGTGKAILCGYPIGFLYWETAPYELVFGPTHHRQTASNHEQIQYEKWIARKMESLGVTRRAVALKGTFLRAQKTDDPEWTHTFRFSPKYGEYMYETEEPARSVFPFVRRRDGIDNTYVGLVNSEMNYFLERGYFVSTLTGGEATVAVVPELADGQQAVPKDAVVFDARLLVPVPATIQGKTVTFTAYVPLAQPAGFAIAPTGKVRLFGEAKVTGDAPDAIAARTAKYAGGKKLAGVEILDAGRIAAFLEARRGKTVTVGFGDTRYKPAADALAALLKAKYAIDCRLTGAGSRISCRWAYQDGFGYVTNGHEEAAAEILIGNCQDDALMWRYTWMWGVSDRYWLPLEINNTFPGAGRAVVMLSAPVATDGSGKSVGKKAGQQLIIGASFPGEALAAVEQMKR